MTTPHNPSPRALARLLRSPEGRSFLQHLPGLASQTQAATAPADLPVVISVRSANGDATAPLAPAQVGLWYLDQLDPEGLAYVIPVAFRLRGALDEDALALGLRALASRHDALRSAFVPPDGVNGEPMQVVRAEVQLELERHTISVGQDLTRQEGVDVWAELSRFAWQPFDLAHGPLVRARLLRLAPDDHILLLALHHIIADGWSLGILYEELGPLYTAACRFSAYHRQAGELGRNAADALLRAVAEAIPLPALRFADYAQAERRDLTQRAPAEIAHWRAALDGVPDVLELPTDFPRPAAPAAGGARLPFTLDPMLSGALRAFSGDEGATLFMTLLAGFQVLLSRYTGAEAFLIGAPVANRTRPDVLNMVGCCVNTLPLRADLTGAPSFRELVQRVREICLDAYEHQAFPLEEIVRALAPTRLLGINPLVQVLFVLQNAPLHPPQLDGLDMTALDVGGVSAKADLTLEMYEDGDGLTGVLEYRTALFSPATMARLINHLRTLLAAAVADPDRPITYLPLLTAAERTQILDDWNATVTPYPSEASVAALFAEQAHRTPDAIALSAGAERLTYGELDARANALAHYLRDELRVEHEELIGVFAPRSLDLVVALLAILKAGAAYLPLDAAAPPERLADTLDDAGCRVLLTHSTLRSAFPAPALETRAVRDLDDVLPRLQARLAAKSAHALAHPVACPATGASLAYVMYTSGSTGRPKGVAIEQHSIVRLVRNTNYARFDAGEVLLLFSPVSFDASTMEIWGALLNGARLAICPPFPRGLLPLDELAAVVEREEVTTAFFTSALFHQLVDGHLPQLRSLRQLLAGGDVLSVAHVTRVARELPGCRMLAVYGPTENTAYSTCYPVAPGEELGASVPIGRPISNTQVYVLDAHLQPVPIGVPGDLYLGGAGLSRGYLHRPELTAERFLANPFFGRGTTGPGPDGAGDLGRIHTRRLYQTGDRVRWRSDGVLLFLGRSDRQVKLRGYRIELGEIETALGQHPAIAQVYVVAREDTPGDKRLVAYIVPQPDAPDTLLADLEEPALRPFLQARLPTYMIPSAFVRLPSLPVTLNGKVDTRLLPVPELFPTAAMRAAPERPAAAPPSQPLTETQARVQQICAEVLGRYPDEVGLDTDFFALGGHSMQTAQVLLRVHKAFVLGAGALPLARFFATPTVRHMAQEVELARGMETVTGGTASSGAEATPHAGLHRAVVQVLPPKEDDDAEAAGRELRADAQLPDDLRQMLLASADVPYIVDPCGASGIFITGATGFLGTYLVDELLRLAPATRLYCLVRAPTIAAGRERLLAARRRYLLTDEATDPRLASALIPVLGDLSQPRLGLDEARWHQLAERVQLIYHCGAQVNFVLPYAQVRAANVLSTTDLLRLACSQPGLRPLHFVSTLSVFPPAGPHVPAAATAHGRTWYENDDLVGYEQALEGGYPQSKWVGERLVTRAGALGLPATIHRPGLITGHSRAGAWNTDDAMCRRLKSYIELGLVPSTGEPLAMTPVDYVAAAVVALTRQASSLGKAFHLTNAESITLPQLGAWCAAHGYPIQLVSPAQFRNAVLQAAEASPDQPLFPLLTALDEADAAPRGQDESANDPDLAAPSAAATQRFDCRNTRAGLASTEIGCPPLDETLLTTYFDFLVRSGYLPVPGSAGGRARDTHTE